MLRAAAEGRASVPAAPNPAPENGPFGRASIESKQRADWAAMASQRRALAASRLSVPDPLQQSSLQGTLLRSSRARHP